ncbi:MAG TPA: hypothetical protein P5277_02380, partial [Candidatus Paceibacterota bacterium]|nr:hypothetical protein [Candidatus Paceibacterota bacterium]
NRLIQDCLYGCSNGACSQPVIECSSNSECNDGDSYTQDVCMSPGTPESYCVHNQLNCVQNSDCGITGYIGSNFCSLNDVFKTFQTAICENPGTLQSNCVISQENRLMNDCGENSCDYVGVPYCLNGDVYQTKRCVERGCSASSCSATTTDTNTQVQDCLYGCSNGACNIPECTQNNECDDGNSRTVDQCTDNNCIHTEVDCLLDLDCGTTGFMGNNFCLTNDLYRLFQTARCENPGTLQSNCVISQENRLIEDCSFTCSNSQCAIPPLCSDGIDNDHDGFIDYPADSGCISMLDNDETNVIPVSYHCSDGIDNDGDSLVDYPNDPGCTSSNDNDESNVPLFPLCSDGIDNDHDGFIDYPADSGCISMLDNSE